MVKRNSSNVTKSKKKQCIREDWSLLSLEILVNIFEQVPTFSHSIACKQWFEADRMTKKFKERSTSVIRQAILDSNVDAFRTMIHLCEYSDIEKEEIMEQAIVNSAFDMIEFLTENGFGATGLNFKLCFDRWRAGGDRRFRILARRFPDFKFYSGIDNNEAMKGLGIDINNVQLTESEMIKIANDISNLRDVEMLRDILSHTEYGPMFKGVLNRMDWTIVSYVCDFEDEFSDIFVDLIIENNTMGFKIFQKFTSLESACSRNFNNIHKLEKINEHHELVNLHSKLIKYVVEKYESGSSMCLYALCNRKLADTFISTLDFQEQHGTATMHALNKHAVLHLHEYLLSKAFHHDIPALVEFLVRKYGLSVKMYRQFVFGNGSERWVHTRIPLRTLFKAIADRKDSKEAREIVNHTMIVFKVKHLFNLQEIISYLMITYLPMTVEQKKELCNIAIYYEWLDVLAKITEVSNYHKFMMAIVHSRDSVVKYLVRYTDFDPSVDNNLPVRVAILCPKALEEILKDDRVDPTALNYRAVYNAMAYFYPTSLEILINDYRVSQTSFLTEENIDVGILDNFPDFVAKMIGFKITFYQQSLGK
jgi:hypothetical protein